MIRDNEYKLKIIKIFIQNIYEYFYYFKFILCKILMQTCYHL